MAKPPFSTTSAASGMSAVMTRVARLHQFDNFLIGDIGSRCDEYGVEDTLNPARGLADWRQTIVLVFGPFGGFVEKLFGISRTRIGINPDLHQSFSCFGEFMQNLLIRPSGTFSSRGGEGLQ